MMRADEFSLVLSFSPTVNGIKTIVPGFYVRASFANEGQAQGVVKGTWDNGRAGNGSLVSRSFLEGLLLLMHSHELLLPGIDGADLGQRLADTQEDRQSEMLEAKRMRLRLLRNEVAALEAEVG